MERLIDAMQTVIKMSGRITPLIQMGANPIQVYNEMLQVVAEAQTVDAVEVVHGRWIKDKQSKFEHRYNCSACNYRLIDEHCNYCLNCGAKMDGDGNG